MAVAKLAEEDIFNVARKIEAPEARADYLHQVCGDDEALRSRIEALLQVHEQEKSFLEPRAVTSAEAPVQTPGVMIGPYKLLQQIGEGGMGTVWMAQQTEPVKRVVALKLIKAGMDSKQVIARFEAERQALALMDHPNIAKVLDAGTIPLRISDFGLRIEESKDVPANPQSDIRNPQWAGRPYFVMDLVKGVPITNYCDEHRLTPKQRLELFIPVCQAVQHAHQKGIIHRDLKPSNVLVALYDGKPVPKVIDFGVAKATAQSLTEKTLVTGFGNIVGTLEYMSPEQAEVNQLDIDTRSDIYSLGVLLYELLAGSPPFTKKDLEKAGMLEMLRVIREQEPSKPSTKLSTAEGLPTLAANRGTEPAKLTKIVRGELDWIVMKALEKDRNRRYETANGFAIDLQRYLADEPVQAGPPSAGYRLRKFLRRNRGPALAAAVVVLALVAGLVGTTLGLLEADQARKDEAEQRRAADINAAKAKDEAENAKTARDQARRLADKEKAARDQAEEQLMRAEWLVYAGRIKLAQHAWESNNARLAFHYLESCRRDLRGWEHDHLFTLFSGTERTLRGHRGEITGMALSDDGRRLVTGSQDNTIKIWDMATGQVLRTLKRHTSEPTSGVSCVALSADGKRIVSGGYDHTVKVWDADTGEAILTLKGHTRHVTGVALSPDGKFIVSGSVDQTLKVWDAVTGAEVHTLRGHSAFVSCVAVTPDGKRIVSGGGGNDAVRVWDLVTGQEVQTLHGHALGVSCVAVTRDGQRIISGGSDKFVKIWDAATGREIRAFMRHWNPVSCVAVSRDGQRIVSGSIDSGLKEWDAHSGQEIRLLRGHAYGVSSVAFSPDGNTIVSGSRDETIKVWSAAAGQETFVRLYNGAAKSNLALSRDGRSIVSGSAYAVKAWDAVSGENTLTLKGHTLHIGGVALSADDKFIVSGSHDQTVKVWDAATGAEIRTLRGHTDHVNGVVITPDGKRIVSGSSDSTVRIWDMATGQELRSLTGHTTGAVCVALSSDGKRIVSGGNDHMVKVWDADTGREMLTLEGHSQPVSGVVFSPDGKFIVSSSQDKTLKVWDATTGADVLTLQGHTDSVSCVAVMPDGKRIVSGSHDRTVKVWDALTGYETLTLEGHASFVNSVSVSHDGSRIFSGGGDGSVKA